MEGGGGGGRREGDAFVFETIYLYFYFSSDIPAKGSLTKVWKLFALIPWTPKSFKT